MMFTAAADIMIVTQTLAMISPAIAAPPLRSDWMCWSPGIGVLVDVAVASTRGATTRLLRRHGGGACLALGSIGVLWLRLSGVVRKWMR